MPDPALPLAGRRILLVEDEYVIAAEMKRWLQAAGCEVLGPVPSVDRALDLIEECCPDAAVLDINLGGGITVYPVADRLGVLGVPYLFATGDTRLSRTDGYCGRPLLEKPFTKVGILRTLAELLATS